MISARRFLQLSYELDQRWVFQRDYLRFSSAAEYAYDSVKKDDMKLYNIKCEIKTSMLSLGTMYVASLLFKFREIPNQDIEQVKMITILWKTEDLSVRLTRWAELTSDNWYKINMWYFTNHQSDAYFNIVIDRILCFDKPAKTDLLIYGIEFQPIETDEDIGGFKNLSIREKEDIIDDDDDDDGDDDEKWEKKLPVDYQRLIGMAVNPLDCPNKKELYLRICEGFLGSAGLVWFSLCRRGICYMLKATCNLILVNEPDNSIEGELYLYKSRFDRVIKLESRKARSQVNLRYIVRESMESPDNTYACYLVFRFKDDLALPDESCLLTAECWLDYTFQGEVFACMTLPSTNIPTIHPNNDYGSPRVEEITVPKVDITHLGYIKIQERKDGWMEVMLCHSIPGLKVDMQLDVKLCDIQDWIIHGMIIEGVEFRPYI